MHGTGNWVLGGLVALMGLIGLFIAAGAGSREPVAYWGGLGFFLFAVLFVFLLIKRSFDRREHHQNG